MKGNTMNTQSITTVEFVVAPLTPKQQYQAGFNAFSEGASLDVNTDVSWRKGWWAALRAGADCETEIYLRNRK